MPRSRAQSDRLKEERRRAILEAAIPLFARNGFSQTSVSDVARAAGVSHGTVFLYFSSKEELFRAALLEPLAEFDQLMRVPPPSAGTPLERLRKMAREQMLMLARQESYVRLTQYVLGQRDRFTDLAEALFEFGRRRTDELAAVITEGQQLGQLAPGRPEVIAWSYFAYTQGVVLVIFDSVDECPGRWEALAENAVRLFGPMQRD